MAQYTEYHPLKFWLDPASIAEIVAHIQTYLVNNPINSTTEIETIIHDYLIAHPELIGGVDSVNGQTGEVVLTADNISGGENVTIKDVLDSLQDQIDDIVASIPSDYQELIYDVSNLKSSFDNKLLIPQSGHTIIQGSYNSSGAVVTNPARIRVSGFIEVKQGEKIKFEAGTNTTGMLVGIFNANKVYQGESWYADGASVDIVSDGFVIIVYRKDTNNTAITPSEYDAVTKIIPIIWNDVNSVTEKFDDIAVFKKSENRLDPNSNIQSGFINPNGGAYSDSTTYKVTDFITIESGKYAIISNSNNEFVSCRFIAEYNANKQIINFPSSEGSGNGTHYSSGYILANQNAKYIRVSYGINLDNSQLMISVSENNITPVFEAYTTPYYIAKEQFIADYVRKSLNIYSSDGINEFYSKMKTAYEQGNTDVHVHIGDYVYTNTLIDSIRSEGKRGIPIGRGCRYYFETGARLVCEYTGTNTADVALLFSALDSQNVAGDYEIYNLDLTVKNILYGIHDEANGYNAFYSHKYKNCYVTLDNTALGTASDYKSRCIGGGLGKHGEIIIEDCVFINTNPGKQTVAEQPVAYHGANGSTFSDVKFIVTGCYFNGLFRGSNLSNNTEAPYPRIIYNNNSHTADPSIDATWTKYVFNNTTN